MPKNKLIREKASVEDIYQNKHFVPPKEQSLETIFEEPRQSKDGAQILTSVKKYKRYLHFDPSLNKIQKRKRKAKKCFKKLKMNYITRSSPENSKTNDISLYILDALGDTTDSDMDDSNSTKTFPTDETPNTAPANLEKEASCSDLLDTPKKNSKRRKSFQLNNQDVSMSGPNEQPDNETNSTISYDSEQTAIVKDEKVESPRRSCCIS